MWSVNVIVVDVTMLTNFGASGYDKPSKLENFFCLVDSFTRLPEKRRLKIKCACLR